MVRRDIDRMRRRRFMNTMVGLGVSIEAMNYLSKDIAAKIIEDPEKEVPRLSKLKHKNPERYSEPPLPDHPPEIEPEFYTISRDRWAVVETSHLAARKIRNRLYRRFDCESWEMSVGVKEMNEGQHTTLGVLVKHIKSIEKKDDDNNKTGNKVKTEEIRDYLPSSISAHVKKEQVEAKRSDIPIAVEQDQLSESEYFNYKYRPIPGGCKLSDKSTFSNEVGSSCTPAWDSDRGKYVLLTAGHLPDNSNDNLQQPKYWGYTKQNQIGNCDKRIKQGKFDVATIDSTKDLIYWTAQNIEDEYNIPIRGIVGIDEIKDNADNSNYELRLQGRTSGITRGEINFVETTDPTNISHECHRIWGTMDSAGGDSGGPHYKVENESNGLGAYIAGVHAWEGGNGDAVSTAIQGIQKEFNLTV